MRTLGSITMRKCIEMVDGRVSLCVSVLISLVVVVLLVVIENVGFKRAVK